MIEQFLPKDTLLWFDLKQCTTDDENIYIKLVEKDLPPYDDNDKAIDPKQIEARRFHDISITDFPIRGKRCLLTFRRRYWKIKGQEKYLKRAIELAHPGTKIQTEFAAFLKDKGGDKNPLARHYSRIP